MTLTTETIVSEAALKVLEPEWRELWANAARPSPFQRFEWVAMCWRRGELAHPGAQRLILVRDDGGLVLAAPMVVRRRFRVAHELAGLATLLPQYDGALLRRDGPHDEWRRAFLGAAMRQPLTLRVCLDRLPADSALAETLRGLRSKRSVYGVATVARMPMGFDAYYASRPKGLRSDHRRQLQRLGEIGEVSFRLADATTLDGDLDWLLTQKRLWQPRQGVLRRWLRSQAAENDLRSFCHAVLADDGLCLGVLRVGERRVGAILCLCAPGEAVCYVLAYDSAFDRYSPGRTAMFLTFEAAARRGITLLDFMGGGADWKARLGTDQTVIERLRLGRRAQ